MNPTKNAIKSMICCVSLSLLASPTSAVVLDNGNSAASVKTQNALTNNAQLAFEGRMQSLLGTNYAKFKAADISRVIPDQYIVVYKKASVDQMAMTLSGGRMAGMDRRARANMRAMAVGQMTTDMTNKFKAKALRKYGHALGGFSVKMKEDALAAMIQDPRVELIEADQLMTATAVQSNATWGLDRIDETDLPLDGFYEYNFDGTGVDAYIVDTGVLASHSQFNGRVTTGFTAINDGRGSNDCNGHGTHVAGTVGATTYGVAKNVNIVPVRVLGCNGSGSNSGVIAGVNYVAQAASGPSVANMSLGGGNSTALDSAVESAISQGITFVVAAGNSNANACSGSPNRVGPALTVGSTTSSDTRSNFSNWGSCVDIFAPGSDITSAWFNSNSALRTISGTSMAAPHVAGVAALYLDQSPTASPAQVEVAIESAGVTGRLSSIRTGSPNLLLQSLLGNGGDNGGGDGGDNGGGDGGDNGGGSCVYEDDFTSSTGWQNVQSSSCSTGSFVRTNPTQMTTSGVITQVDGDAGGDGFAAFTATNTSAGQNDVDGGECIAQSPSISVSDSSTLSLAWFHGQRDTGDDQNGDFFAVEYSTNGGSSYNSLVQIGDTRTQAQWQNASAQIPAGSNVRIRVRVSDGAGAGDIIEGGIDSVKICSN